MRCGSTGLSRKLLECLLVAPSYLVTRGVFLSFTRLATRAVRLGYGHCELGIFKLLSKMLRCLVYCVFTQVMWIQTKRAHVYAYYVGCLMCKRIGKLAYSTVYSFLQQSTRVGTEQPPTSEFVRHCPGDSRNLRPHRLDWVAQ